MSDASKAFERAQAKLKADADRKAKEAEQAKIKSEAQAHGRNYYDGNARVERTHGQDSGA